jgi:glycosyltransferase involved in cell wall biosynthesis
MAGFCPVIGPDTPGIRDVLIDNQTGRVFDPRYSESLLKMISWTLDAPQAVQSLTQAARTLVEQHYTMDTMGRHILRIYRLHLIKINRKFQTTL